MNAVMRSLGPEQQEVLRFCLRGDESDDDGSSPPSRGTSPSPRSTPGDGVTRRGGHTPGQTFYAALHQDSGDEGSEPDVVGTESLEDFSFRICSWDSDDGDAGPGLEDMYRFDLDCVAAALRRGADADELIRAFEESMCNDLESRLSAAGDLRSAPRSAPRSTPRSAQSSFGGEGLKFSGASTPVERRLSGLMTPEPRPEPQDQADAFRGESTAMAANEISRRLAQAEQLRRRRFSALEHRRLTEAVREETSKRRQSLQQIATRRLSREVARRFVVHECRLHRKGLLKAVEVLETAGVGSVVESVNHDEAEVSRQLRRVSDAMQAASRKHREHVVNAVRAVGGVPMPCQGLTGERIQQVVERAFARCQELQSRKGKEEPGHSRARGPPTPSKGALFALAHARSGDLRNTVHVGPRPAGSARP